MSKENTINEATRIKFILALAHDDIKSELEKNNILIKDGAFTLNNAQKSVVEEKVKYNFKKKYFTSKNRFIYNLVKNTLEDEGFTFLTSDEIEKKISTSLEELKKELEAEADEADEAEDEADEAEDEADEAEDEAEAEDEKNEK